MTGPIGAVGGSGFSPPAGTSKAKSDTQNGFGAVLQQELERTRTRQVAFSKHALNRAEERGIEVTPALLERLGDSVERAEAKGATNILALDQSLAFIVNVPHNRVITTLSETEMKDSIFTNIDGAVFL
ncbi:TIGR02530 family flagellar biosynthesis protein [Flavonifractor plautii]|mgnify:FL=1|uniref:TIGR02530 family flagellar biosynthesis protein n=1 Tax=Flavonifractor plautii TaxID=292800 RepID=UPI0031F7011B